VGINDKPFIHGGVIALLLFIFFPIGITLFLIRAFKHRNLTHMKVLDLRFCGHALLTFFLLLSVGFLANIAAGTSGAVGIYIFCIILILLPSLYCYRRAKKLSRAMSARFGLYHSMIYTEKITSIDHMADRAKVRTEIALNELYRMAAMRQLPNAYIDNITYQVVLRENDVRPAAPSQITIATEILAAASAGIAAAVAQAPLQPEPAAATPKTVECRSCGATALLKPGESKECEYCMSIVQYGT